MKKLEYTVEFVTPAFLGNAEHAAQWRTPPFKAMLRQWWRVLNAKRYNFDEKKLRESEGVLFGKALDGDSCQSKIRVRLMPAASNQSPWTLPPVKPMENPTPEQVYIGYGPITNGAVKQAISVGQKAKLVLIIDNDVNEIEIDEILLLCNQFATMGSRSRNGWGSLKISGVGTTFANLPRENIESAANINWSHCIGVDEMGKDLIWKTTSMNTWKDIMKEFSRIRKETINKAVSVSERPIISYPVTKNHSFGSTYRLPSQFIFKAISEGEKLYGIIVHMPHKPAIQNVGSSQLCTAWRKIHRGLEDSSGLERASLEEIKQ